MIRLQTQAFDPGVEMTRFCAGRVDAGAVASFVGLARGEPGAAVALELEAWPGFTEPRIAEIIDQARERFGLIDVSVIHRYGPIPTGDPIVMVLTAAGHRREAFEACDFLMDYLKSRAPFWKNEPGPDGRRWIEPTERDLADARRWG